MQMNMTQDTPFGTAEISLTKVGSTHEATVLLPSGSELEISVEGKEFCEALQIIEDSIDFWCDESAGADMGLEETDERPWE